MSLSTLSDILADTSKEAAAFLIVDNLQANATFLLAHFASRAIKSKQSCLLVSVGETYVHYAAILRRAGATLPKDSFLEVNTSDTRSVTASIFSWSEAHLSSMSSAIVLIDDLTALLWLGACDVKGLVVFQQKMLALCRQHSASLVSVFHGDDTFASATEGEPSSSTDDLALRHLLRLNDIWIQTKSLQPQIMGELLIHRLPGLADARPSLTVTSRDRPYQYKLDETGPKLWYKGTGAGFL